MYNRLTQMLIHSNLNQNAAKHLQLSSSSHCPQHSAKLTMSNNGVWWMILWQNIRLWSTTKIIWSRRYCLWLWSYTMYEWWWLRDWRLGQAWVGYHFDPTPATVKRLRPGKHESAPTSVMAMYQDSVHSPSARSIGQYVLPKVTRV